MHGCGITPPEDDHWMEDKTCSYCGSMSPEALFKAVESGEKLGPTDKDYKVYVGATHKFYFQHFSKEDWNKFTGLLNAGSIKLGHPGRFYVLPFALAKV